MHRQLQTGEATQVNVADDAGGAAHARDPEVFLGIREGMAAETGGRNLAVERLATRRVVVDQGNQFSLGRHRMFTRRARYTWPWRIPYCSCLPSPGLCLPRGLRVP